MDKGRICFRPFLIIPPFFSTLYKSCWKAHVPSYTDLERNPKLRQNSTGQPTYNCSQCNLGLCQSLYRARVCSRPYPRVGVSRAYGLFGSACTVQRAQIRAPRIQTPPPPWTSLPHITPAPAPFHLPSCLPSTQNRPASAKLSCHRSSRPRLYGTCATALSQRKRLAPAMRGELD